MSSRILLVYFTHTGMTGQIAKLIRRVTDCDEEQIIPQVPYPEDVFKTIKQVRHDGPLYRPVINEFTHDVKKYGTVIIGTPVWTDGLPPPVLTFLEANDWRGVKIFPFFSTGGVYIDVYPALQRKCEGAAIATPLYLVYDLNGRFLDLRE